MIKRFPNRNPRSKGIKVKHILQIVLLLGVCFWLIYQVKHNRGRKKEFDVDDDAKLSVTTHQTDQIVKLGRKDLHPGKDELDQNEKHEEDEEDEHVVEDEENKHEHDEHEEEERNKHEIEERKDSKHEGREQEEEENKHRAEVLEEEIQHEHDDEQEQEEERNQHETEESKDDKHEGREREEEENKHGAEELKEDENRSEEMEDEVNGGGGGDDEIDENDQEKSGVDMDHDDEKDKEEGDAKENDEDSEDEEKGGLAENDGNHVAREEHYKGDDASSAVAHDTHATSTETFGVENSGVNLEINITKPENETTYSDESNNTQNDSNLKVIEGEGVDRIPSNASSGKETGNESLFNTLDSSYLNKTSKTSSNLIGADANTSTSSEQNKTVETTMITGDIKNMQTEGLRQNDNRISEENLPATDSMVSVKTENGGPAAGESLNLRDGESEKANETENSSSNLDRNESSDTTESDESKVSGESNESQNIDATEDALIGGGTDETSDSFSADEILDSVEHDAIDSFDTHIHDHKDAAEVRTDLDTLPDVRNEGYNGDETAAE